MKSALRTPLLAMLAIAACLCGFSRIGLAEDRITADHRLPPGVLLYFSCPDVPTSVEQFKSTAFGELINDPRMADFREQLLDRYQELATGMEETLELETSDLLSLFSGEVTVAVLRPIGQPPGGVLFIEVGDQQATLEQLIAKADENDEGRIEKETKTLKGVEVTVCTVLNGEEEESEDLEDETPANSFVYFIHEGTFVVTSSQQLAEDVITRWDGNHQKTFATTPIFQEILDRCRGEEGHAPALVWFMDPLGLISAGLSMSPQTQLFAVGFNSYLPVLGLNRFKGMGGIAELATEEFDSVSRTLYYVEQPASGALKIFDLRQTVSNPPAWVPENSGQFFSFDWNISEAYSTIESLYDTIVGQPGGFELMVDRLSTQAEGPHLHPKKDVIDVLTGAVQLFVIPGQDGRPEQMRGVVALGVKDTESAEKLVASILESAGETEQSDFEGTTVYRPADEGMPGAVAVKDSTIYLAAGMDLLKDTLRGRAEKPLAESEQYQAVAEVVPDKVSLLVYQNAASQFESAYESLRRGDYDSFVEGKFDFSTLPPFEEIREYFTPKAGYIIPDEKGALSVQFSLKRKSR